MFAHHPYSVSAPRRHALSRNDISVPDVSRLTRAVSQAVKRGTARPRKRKPLWITELGWDSRPPDPNGVPARRHASWLADGFFVLWKQRAEKVVWTFVRDQAPTGGYGGTYQSGIFLLDGTPKLAQQAITFPVVLRAHEAREAACLGQGAGRRSRGDRARRQDRRHADRRAAPRVPQDRFGKGRSAGASRKSDEPAVHSRVNVRFPDSRA